MKRSLPWRNLLGTAVSLACLGYVLAGLDLGRLWELTLHTPLIYFLAVNVVWGGILWLRTLRWRVMLEPVRLCGVGQLYSAGLIGHMANNLLPARLGELVRAYAAQHRCQVPLASSLATFFLEYVLDGLTALLILFATLLYADPGVEVGALGFAAMRTAGMGLLLAFLGLLALLLALWRWPQATIDRLTRWLAHLSPKLAAAVEPKLLAFHQGLAILGRVRRMPTVVVYSVLMQFLALAVFVLFLPALGLPLSIFVGAMAYCGSSLAAVLPAAPGMVGTLQLGVMWAMMLAGVDRERAAAFGLLLWTSTYIPLTCAGMVELWRSGLTLKALRGRTDRA